MCPPSRNRNRNRKGALSEIKSWTAEPWKVKEAFSVLDKDGDGKISLSDLQHFFSAGKGAGKGPPLSREEMESMISVADADNSGSVDFEEFHTILRLKIDEKNESRSNITDEYSQMWPALKEAFNVMDRDGDGILSAEDLKTFFSFSVASGGSSTENYCNSMMSDDDLADMIKAAGGSAKCGVCYEDFARLMMTMMNGFS